MELYTQKLRALLALDGSKSKRSERLYVKIYTTNSRAVFALPEIVRDMKITHRRTSLYY